MHRWKDHKPDSCEFWVTLSPCKSQTIHERKGSRFPAFRRRDLVNVALTAMPCLTPAMVGCCACCPSKALFNSHSLKLIKLQSSSYMLHMKGVPISHFQPVSQSWRARNQTVCMPLGIVSGRRSQGVQVQLVLLVVVNAAYTFMCDLFAAGARSDALCQGYPPEAGPCCISSCQGSYNQPACCCDRRGCLHHVYGPASQCDLPSL